MNASDRRAPAAMAGDMLSAVASAPAQLTSFLRSRYPSVAVTGMSGVGKTQLIDRLAGHSTGEGVTEVGSAVLERRTQREAKMRGFRFRVVPGENAATRLSAIDEVFHDEPVSGVLHVVANGYATPRRFAGSTRAAQPADREAQLAAELEDWSITSHRIASMAIRRDTPTWLIIAVSKVDLYPQQIDQVVQYYSPDSGSPFAEKVEALRNLTGAAKLSIDVMPVCSASTGTYHDPAVRNNDWCETHLKALRARMSQLAGHV